MRQHPAGAARRGRRPAIGECAAAAAGTVSNRIPASVEHLAGQHVAIVGAGHSAIHAAIALDALARRAPGTRITWVLRRDAAGDVFGGGDGDDLQQRAALGSRARAAVDAGRVVLAAVFRVADVRADGTLVADDGRTIEDVAHAFALTGFRPDLGMLGEMRLAIDPALEAVAGIAAEIDPSLHSRGSVGATGAAELAHPEPGLFVVGAKSYGRAPTFLALTGYERVRSVAAHLAGDHEAAARSELALPETGVCGGSGSFDAPTTSCCAPTPALVELGARSTP